jgi:type IV conjugative transfer system protein TraE
MVIAGVLLAVNAMLAVFVVRADTREKTIIVPPHFDRPFAVRGSELSPAYIEQMGRYFASLLLTYHKQTARAQFHAALQYFAPQGYGKAKAALDAEAERIERNGLAAAYYISSVEITANTACITGTSLGMMGKQIVSRQMRSYSITFHYGSGQLFITDFHESASAKNKEAGDESASGRSS